MGLFYVGVLRICHVFIALKNNGWLSRVFLNRFLLAVLERLEQTAQQTMFFFSIISRY